MGSSCGQLFYKYPLFGEGLDVLTDPSPSSAMPWKPLWRSPFCGNYSFNSTSGTPLPLGNIPFGRCSCYILRFQPKADTKTERDAMRPSTVPASCGIRKLGMSDHGCDRLEGSQTPVESATIRRKMVWRPIHGYGLKKMPTTFANLKIVSWKLYKMDMSFTQLSRRYLLYLSTFKPAYSVLCQYLSSPIFSTVFHFITSLRHWKTVRIHRPRSIYSLSFIFAVFS